MASGKSNVRLNFGIDSSEYQKKMREMVAQMKELGSAYSLTQTEAKLLGSESGVLKSRVTELTAKLELQKNIIKENERYHSDLTEELKKAKEHYQKLAPQVEDARKAYEKSKTELGENADETKKLKTELNELLYKYDQAEKYIDKTSISLTNQQTKINNAKTALAEMEIELREVREEMARAPFDKFEEGCSKVSRACESIGRQLTVVSGGIVALGGTAAKSAIEFESAFAGVEKTVDATPEQLAEISAGIKELAEVIPASTTEIAAVAEAAGQLGIKTDDILNFTEVMINLGVATNLSSDEAASALAKFANVTKMSADDYGRLGSVIVALGNNFATTESDIVAMATRLASTGEIVGLTEPQIMAIATALSSVGIEAEAGGSAISKLLKQIETSAKLYGTAKEAIDATGFSMRELELMASLDSAAFKGVCDSLGLTTAELKNYMSSASDLEKFAEIAGLSADKFIAAWGKDAVSALDLFITGLNDTERTGASAVEILDQMGITEIRLSNAVLALSASGGILTETVDLANNAWTENNALTAEAEKRYETTESRLQICKNAVNNLAISFGERLLPYIERGIEKVTELSNRFDSLTDEQKDTVIQIGAVGAAAGPTLLAIGKLTGGLGTVSGAFGTVVGKIAGSGGLSGVLTALTSPVGLVIAAIAALAAGLGYVVATNEDVRSSLMGVLQDLGQSLQPAMVFFSDTVLPDMRDGWNELLLMLEPFGTFLEGAFTDAWNVILIPALQYCADEIIPDLTSVFRQLWQDVLVPLGELTGDILTPTFEWLSEVLTVLWQDVVVPFSDALGGVFAQAWEGLAQIAQEVAIPELQKLTEEFKVLWNDVLMPLFSWLSEVFGPYIEIELDSLSGRFDAVKDQLGGLLEFLTGAFTSDWKKAWNGLKTFGTGVWSDIVNSAETRLNKLKTFVSNVVNAIKDFFNIELKFKGIKLPHISISYDTEGLMAEAAKLVGLPGIPKFSVAWYKNGGIMTDPTVFGRAGDRLLAGGEAGAEAILPLDSFYSKLSALLDRKFEAFVAQNRINVTTVVELDGEVIAEKTTERVEDNIVRDLERRR